jgi:hypothetical protein
MNWSRCGCDIRLLVRLDRTFWMRFVARRRHYYCPRCGIRQFLSRRSLREAVPGARHLHAAETAHGSLT